MTVRYIRYQRFHLLYSILRLSPPWHAVPVFLKILVDFKMKTLIASPPVHVSVVLELIIMMHMYAASAFFFYSIPH